MSGSGSWRTSGRRCTPPSSAWGCRRRICSAQAPPHPRHRGRQIPPTHPQGKKMTAVIEARGLAKSYGSFRALDDVSFSVAPGRIVGLIGPNGAGKTTAIKAILGLTPFQGELKV